MFSRKMSSRTGHPFCSVGISKGSLSPGSYITYSILTKNDPDEIGQ